jgi:ADP-heptose:LPS heptosyltransferase
VGDGLLKLPTINAFGNVSPPWQITWVTGKNPSIFSRHFQPLVDTSLHRVLEQTGIGQRWIEGFSTLGDNPFFDSILCTESKLKPTLVLKRIPHHRFVSPAFRFRFSSVVPRLDQFPSGVSERFNFLCSVAIDQQIEQDCTVTLPRQFEMAARSLLPDGKSYVGFCPGAGGVAKRWPLDRYLALARKAIGIGATPVFFVGPEEADIVSLIKDGVPEALMPEIDLSNVNDGANGPLLTIALARKLALGVSNDAGGGHLLAAGGRPQIRLYKSTHGIKFKSPYGHQESISAEDNGLRRMSDIPVEIVWHKLLEVMDAVRRE